MSNEQLKEIIGLKIEVVDEKISHLKIIDKYRKILEQCDPFDENLHCRFCKGYMRNGHAAGCEYMRLLEGENIKK